MRLFLLLMVITGTIFCGSPAQAGPASSPLPLDSWIYPALDKLAGLGLIDSALQGSRPYSRLEAARQTAEARLGLAAGPSPGVARELVRRLERELREPLQELAAGREAGPAGYLKPLRDLTARYLYLEGVPSPIPGINSRQFSLNYNNFGIDYDEHHNGQLTFEGEARLGESLLLHWRPLVLTGEEDTTVRLLHGTVALALGPLELSAGRQSLWWGQGRHGSLILTSNAKPLDLIRLTNPTPGLLPWIFKYLGPFRFDVFWSRLEEERVVPEPYFAGLRLNFKPLPLLEIGAARTVIFGGEGRPGVGFSDFFTILTGHNLSGADDTSNQLAALDGVLRLPFLWGAQLYGEWGGEDEAGGFIANKAYLAGLYLPRLEPSGRLSLRLEYADLSKVDDNSPPWYRHGIYQSGYTYKQKILGHHVGGAAEDLFSELELVLPDDLTLRLSYDYERRGVNLPVAEKHAQPAVELEWSPSARIEFRARYALDRVENFNYLAGDDRNFHLAEFGLTSNW